MATLLDLGQNLADLHDSEINVALSWLWDDGVDVALGDYEGHVDSVAEVGGWFRANAVSLYPDSDFARKYARGFE